MSIHAQDDNIKNQLFTSDFNPTEFDKAFSEFTPITLSILKFRNHLMPLILEVACGEYGFRNPGYAAGVHPEAFAYLLKKTDIKLLRAFNDPLTIAFYNAPVEIAKCFFEHYLFLNSKEEPVPVLSSIVSAIYAVKQRPDSKDKSEILRFLDEQRATEIQGHTIGTFLDMSANELKQHEFFHSLIAVDRTVDQIASDHVMNEMGGSLPYVAPEATTDSSFPALELSRRPKRTVAEECSHRFIHSKKSDVTYDDLISAVKTKCRISRQDDDGLNHQLVYLPKITACLFRNFREKTTGQPLLIHAVNKGLYSTDNPDGIRKENLDEFFFEKYLGYRNLRAQHQTDIHGKEFILNDYIKNAVRYFAQNKEATNRDEILQYLWSLDGIGIMTGSRDAISVKDFLIQNNCDANLGANKVKFN